MKHQPSKYLFMWTLALPVLAGCNDESGRIETTGNGVKFELAAVLENPELNEISGIEAASDGHFFVHNDEGKPLLHVIDRNGRYLDEIEIEDARNRDWEDIAGIPRPDGRLLVVGDTGDNQARHKNIRLYFVREPQMNADGRYPEKVELLHLLKVRYPDGPRDCEAMAYDAASNRILFMTKRDSIPRLYGLPVESALTRESAELVFLGEVPTFSPPTAQELLRSGKKAFWLSQPTGMDISDDGLLATVITYRSLYLYSREIDESWPDAFQRIPREFIGPPGVYEEAVTFDVNQDAIYITTEKVPTPLYRLELP